MVKPGTTKRATAWRRLLLTGLALAVGLLAAGCEGSGKSEAPESSTLSASLTPTTTAVTLPQSQSDAPLVSRWPPGVAALVLLQSDGYAGVDGKGVRYKLTNPDQSTERGPNGEYVNREAADIVLSNNGRYLAYRYGGGDLLVFALDTGVVLGTVRTRFTDNLAAISDDGKLVLLVDEGTGPGIVSTAPAGPLQTISIADVTTGETRIPSPIAEAMGSIDDPFLNGSAWLSDQSAFLLWAIHACPRQPWGRRAPLLTLARWFGRQAKPPVSCLTRTSREESEP